MFHIIDYIRFNLNLYNKKNNNVVLLIKVNYYIFFQIIINLFIIFEFKLYLKK